MADQEWIQAYANLTIWGPTVYDLLYNSYLHAFCPLRKGSILLSGGLSHDIIMVVEDMFKKMLPIASFGLPEVFGTIDWRFIFESNSTKLKGSLPPFANVDDNNPPQLEHIYKSRIAVMQLQLHCRTIQVILMNHLESIKNTNIKSLATSIINEMDATMTLIHGYLLRAYDPIIQHLQELTYLAPAGQGGAQQQGDVEPVHLLEYAKPRDSGHDGPPGKYSKNFKTGFKILY